MQSSIIQDEKLNQQLEIVAGKMKEQTKSGDRYLNGSLDYLMLAGGKMLRPSLLLIGSKIGRTYKKREEELLNMATAIETIHLATLVHDDIIDQSDTRRGQPSIQSKYGQSYAVYMGDYLLSQCFLMLTHLDLEKDQAVRLAKVVSRICVGDMKQHQMRYNQDVTPYQYIKMVSGKTAALISVALSSGAYYTKAKEAYVKLLGRIGYEMGMTFQLVDDILDFEGEKSIVGKDVQVDVARGNYSMPIIFCLQRNDEWSKKLRDLLSGKGDQLDYKAVIDTVVSSGSLDETKTLAKRYNERAMNLVSDLPEGETKEQLSQLIPSLLNRLK